MKAHCIGKWIYESCVPQSNRIPNVKICGRLPYSSYVPLVFYGICPGSIWAGVGYALTFDLNLPIAFLILCTANAAKIVAFGYLALVANVWLVVAIVLAIPIMRKQIEKYLRAKPEISAEESQFELEN